MTKPPPSLLQEQRSHKNIQSMSTSSNFTVNGDFVLDEFKKHGVVQYMRPDGFGTKPKIKEDGGIALIEAQWKGLDKTSLSSYNNALVAITRSTAPDKANQAGRLLKAMKENSVVPSNTTRRLLAKCSRIEKKSAELRVHEVNVQLEDVEETVIEEKTQSPVKVVKKKVRFSEDKNTTRIIRRRRSISSTERLDDPLTPPKRVSGTLDLALSRFSSGIQDNKPSLPSRCGSVSTCSHRSGGSKSTSVSNGSSDKSSFVSEMRQLRLPFGQDAPILVTRMHITRTRCNRDKADGSTQPAEGISLVDLVMNISNKNTGGDAPTIPVRKRGNDDSPMGSPEQPIAKTTEVLNVKVEPTILQSSEYEVEPTEPCSKEHSVASPTRKTRQTLKRRSSIGYIERRADGPLTPPRRVSAPLEFFITQSTQKNKSCSSDALERRSLPKDTVERVRDSAPSLLPHKKASRGIKRNEIENTKLLKSSRQQIKSDDKSTRPKMRETLPSSTIRKQHSARNDDNDMASLSSINRHHTSVSDRWTKIRLPRRSSDRLLTSSEHLSSSHSCRIYHSRTSNASQLRRESREAASGLGSQNVPKKPSSQWMKVDTKNQVGVLGSNDALSGSRKTRLRQNSAH